MKTSPISVAITSKYGGAASAKYRTIAEYGLLQGRWLAELRGLSATRCLFLMFDDPEVGEFFRHR